MTAVELRSELKLLLDRISDLEVLSEMRTWARRTAEKDSAFEEMNRMADLSDEAIAKGEVYTHEEVLQYLAERRKKK